MPDDQVSNDKILINWSLVTSNLGLTVSPLSTKATFYFLHKKIDKWSHRTTIKFQRSHK